MIRPIIRDTLWGPVDLEETAMDLLKMYEPPEGFYVAFSGGKDSVVTLDLVRRSGVKHDATYNHTSVDPPELVHFIRKNYPDVVFRYPKENMWELILREGFPPTRIARFCCEKLKEGGGLGRFVVTGVRREESVRRSKRRQVEACYTKNIEKRYLHAIIDWTEREVWEYIRNHKLPYCSLYDEGWKRIGCVMCPMSRKKNRMRDIGRWPKIADGYRRTFKRIIEQRRGTDKPLSWNNENEVFDWWLEITEREDPDDNLDLFS
jgi:phosphoadenosine phosphosulfate reductase